MKSEFRLNNESEAKAAGRSLIRRIGSASDSHVESQSPHDKVGVQERVANCASDY